MVSPPTTDLQIARGVTLLLETAGRDQSNGRRIARLNVRLQPMQLERLKRVAHYSLKALAHKTLTLTARKSVVAKVPALEQASNDTGKADDAYQSPGFTVADKEAIVCRGNHPPNVRAELRGRVRGSDPWVVEGLAGTHRCEEGLQVGQSRRADADTGPHAA